MPSTKRAAIYIRVSTEQQNLDLQKNELFQYCEIRKWTDVKVYSDFGISGSRSDNRPEFKRMMKDAKARRFDTVIVWKLDRFGRSLIDLVNHLQELTDLGIEFISLRDGIDLSTSAGKLMCGLIASFAQYERDILKERTIAGLAAARKRGKVLGRPKQRDDRAIAELRNKGLSIQAIAKQLQVSKGSVQAALAACTKNASNFRRSA
jgi:DNA invertase Pin-like site-specific DNA recombinase